MAKDKKEKKAAEPLFEEIYEITGKRLHAGVSEFKGAEYAAIRFQFENQNGEWRFTKNGINISLADGPEEIVTAAQALLNVINAYFDMNFQVVQMEQ